MLELGRWIGRVEKMKIERKMMMIKRTYTLFKFSVYTLCCKHFHIFSIHFSADLHLLKFLVLNSFKLQFCIYLSSDSAFI